MLFRFDLRVPLPQEIKVGINKGHQQKHGNYPDTLSPLTPEIITELPTDPFTGKNYIYRREGKGFIVYSVGSNERDDKGVSDSKQHCDDIAFKITE